MILHLSSSLIRIGDAYFLNVISQPCLLLLFIDGGVLSWDMNTVTVRTVFLTVHIPATISFHSIYIITVHSIFLYCTILNRADRSPSSFNLNTKADRNKEERLCRCIETG